MSTLDTPWSGLRAAFFINLGSAIGGNLLRFGVSLVLARLLVPAELGLVAIALALLGVAQMLRDLGVGNYLQREAELSPGRFASCWGFLIGSTALLGLLLLGASGPLARHFGQPALQPLLVVLLLGFALSPFSLVMAALMQRELAAARIAYVSRLGALAHALSAVGLAAAGFGAMSLAWAYVVNILVCSCAYWPMRPMRPDGFAWKPSAQGWRPLLRFGAGTLLVNGLASVNNALPDLLLGRLGTAAQVGLMGRANAVVNLFNAMLGNAANFGALRSLAELHHRRAALAPLLLRATALLTGAGWPVLALIALFKQEVVRLLYGPAWLGGAPAVLPLAAAAALGLLFNYTGAALAAIGRPQLAALPLAITLLARLGLVACFFDGEGLSSFAWALLGAALAALPLQVWLLLRTLELGAAALLACVLRSLLPSLAALAVAALLRPISVPLALLAAGPAWWLALHAVRHELRAELLDQLLPRLRSTIRK